MYRLSVLLLIISCGKIDHEVSTPNDLKITLEPDFERVAIFCDERYGEKTIEAEECFKDFRNYYDIETTINNTGVIEYCESKYNNEFEVTNCVDEIISFM